MIVQLTGDFYIAADQVAEVRAEERREAIRLTTKAGTVHTIPANWGESKYDAVRRIVAAVNDALGKAQP